MFKVNNKNTKTTSMTSISSVSIVDFKHVNVNWFETSYSKGENDKHLVATKSV